MSPSTTDPVDSLALEPGSCAHLQACSEHTRKEMQKKYRRCMSWVGGMDGLPVRALKQRKLPYPSCSFCSLLLPHPTICLNCDQILCRPSPKYPSEANPTASGSGSSSGSRAPPGAVSGAGIGGTGAGAGGKGKMKMGGCAADHVKDSGHEFTLDTSTGSIYCYPCSSFVYPEGFVVIASRVKRMAEERGDGSTMAAKRAKFKVWNPNDETKILLNGLDKIKCHGLRPLLNLSQTCFLSAILQAFLHNPLLRAYYLSDKHNRKACEGRRAGSHSMDRESSFNGSGGGGGGYGTTINLVGGGVSGVDGEDEMGGDGERVERESDAGSVIFSGGTNGGNGIGDGGSGGGGVAGGVGECMGCEMDKAFQEAYNEEPGPYGPVSMLYAMWKASDELAGYAQQDAHTFFLAALNQIHAHSVVKGDRPERCMCIAHQAFGGTLLSTVTCAKCNTSTRTEEPLLDLNLELKTGSLPGLKPLPSRPELHGGLTLSDCLKRYTTKEALSERAYVCANCKEETMGATKQLSIKKLPATLAIQLKRFEHRGEKPSKVETMVYFPANLDMRSYTSDVVHRQKGQMIDLPMDMYQYQLSAVVTHEGKLDNGHYWADVRNGSEWFRCDDDKISNMTLGSVLAQKAYMLFYVKKSLAYEIEA